MLGLLARLHRAVEPGQLGLALFSWFVQMELEKIGVCHITLPAHSVVVVDTIARLPCMCSFSCVCWAVFLQ